MYRYLPLALIGSIVVFCMFKGFSAGSVLALIPLAFVAYKYEDLKTNEKKNKLEIEVEQLKVEMEKLQSDIQETRTHLSSIKLNQSMKRTL